MGKYISDSAKASDPGPLRVSADKFEELVRPTGLVYALTVGLFRKIFPAPLDMEYVQEHMMYGDSRAAVVVTTSPYLMVACYTDELDCVKLVRHPKKYASRYELSVGSRLLTVNTYGQGEPVDTSLIPGPLDTGRYTRFNPIVAEFISDDMDRINERKRAISEAEWTRAYEMGLAYLRDQIGLEPR